LVASNADTNSLATSPANIDTSPDFHSDTDRNGDTKTNPGADTAADTETNSNADTKSNPDINAETNRNARANPIRDAVPERNADNKTVFDTGGSFAGQIDARSSPASGSAHFAGGFAIG